MPGSSAHWELEHVTMLRAISTASVNEYYYLAKAVWHRPCVIRQGVETKIWTLGNGDLVLSWSV